MTRVPRPLASMPCMGWMYAGRNMYAALNGIARSAFSVAPLTRAHIVRPFSVLSVPAPVT
jgi:hypothetical protein